MRLVCSGTPPEEMPRFSLFGQTAQTLLSKLPALFQLVNSNSFNCRLWVMTPSTAEEVAYPTLITGYLPALITGYLTWVRVRVSDLCILVFSPRTEFSYIEVHVP